MSLPLDDLAPGQWVTVLSWKPRALVPLGGVAVVTTANRSYMGEPLRVVAVQLPYVVVETPYKTNRALDTRECELQRLSDEYVSALGVRAAAPGEPTR